MRYKAVVPCLYLAFDKRRAKSLFYAATLVVDSLDTRISAIMGADDF
jgi:hypothetical protein